MSSDSPCLIRANRDPVMDAPQPFPAGTLTIRRVLPRLLLRYHARSACKHEPRRQWDLIQSLALRDDDVTGL
jgi:hypothetical protein